MDGKTFENTITYSKKLLPKRISNLELEMKKTDSNKKSREITKNASPDLQNLESKILMNKKLQNQEKIQKITKILQEIKETKENLMKNEKSREKTKKRLDKINLIIDEKYHAASRSPDFNKPIKDHLISNNIDNYRDLIKTISKKDDDKEENFFTNDTLHNYLDLNSFKNIPTKSKSGINTNYQTNIEKENQAKFSKSPINDKNIPSTNLKQNFSSPYHQIINKKDFKRKNNLIKSNENIKNIVNIDVSFDEKNDKSPELEEKETFHLRDHSQPSKIISTQKENWKTKPTHNIEKLHDKLKHNVDKFIKKHKFSAILMGTREYNGKSPDDYLRKLHSHINKNNSSSDPNDLNPESLQKLIDDFISKQEKVNNDGNTHHSQDVASKNNEHISDSNKYGSFKKYSYDSNFDQSNKKSSYDKNNSKSKISISKSNYTSNNILYKKPFENRTNNFIRHENDNNISSSQVLNEEKPVGKIVNLNSINTNVIKNHLIGKSKSNNKVAKMKISAKIGEVLSNDLELTPIPYKNEWKGYKYEKEEYIEAARSAVFVRRLEYSTKLQNLKSEKYIEELHVQFQYQAKVIQIQRWFRNSLIKRRKSSELNNNLLRDKLDSIIDLIKTRIKAFVLRKLIDNIRSMQNTVSEKSISEVSQSSHNEESKTITRIVYLQSEIREFIKRQRRKKIIFRKIMFKIFKRNLGFCFKMIKNHEIFICKIINVQRFFRRHNFRTDINKVDEFSHPLLVVFLKNRNCDKYYNIKRNFLKAVKMFKFLKNLPHAKKKLSKVVRIILTDYFNRVKNNYFRIWFRKYKITRRICTMIMFSFRQIIRNIAFLKFFNQTKTMRRSKDFGIYQFIYKINVIFHCEKKIFLGNLKKYTKNRQIVKNLFTLIINNNLFRIIEKKKIQFLFTLEKFSFKINNKNPKVLKPLVLLKSLDEQRNFILSFKNWQHITKKISIYYYNSSLKWQETLQKQILIKIHRRKKKLLLASFIYLKSNKYIDICRNYFFEWKKNLDISIILGNTIYLIFIKLLIFSIKNLAQKFNQYQKTKKIKSIFGLIKK